jgi:hypothetical protein
MSCALAGPSCSRRLVCAAGGHGGIPGQAFIVWESAGRVLLQAIQAGRHADIGDVVADALERSEPAHPEWYDVIDVALNLIAEAEVRFGVRHLSQ